MSGPHSLEITIHLVWSGTPESEYLTSALAMLRHIYVQNLCVLQKTKRRSRKRWIGEGQVTSDRAGN